MKTGKTIRLFWWSEPKLMGKVKENYGDLMGQYLVERISKKRVVWAHPKKWSYKDFFQPIYVTAGSILAQVNKKCVVWGSGIIQKDQVVKPAQFVAVRGPQTRKNLIAQGYEVPEVYGDPAVLLPVYYRPKIKKTYRLGIVPHYNNYKQVVALFGNDPSILIIDLMTNHIEATTNLLLQCERILSSSLHGLIVAHAYGIPAVWVEFSNKLFGDGVKFQDYFESVNLKNYSPNLIQNTVTLETLLSFFNHEDCLPNQDKIKNRQHELMRVCPFVS